MNKYQQTPSDQWLIAEQAWRHFAQANPILDLRPSKWAFNNFLRTARPALLKADAIRKAKSKHWIAHLERFPKVAFDILTGAPQLSERGMQ